MHISSPEQAETLALDKTMSKVETDGQAKTPKIDKRDKALQAEIDRINELFRHREDRTKAGARTSRRNNRRSENTAREMGKAGRANTDVIDP